jgi:Uma2 family endonuclease
MTTFAAQPRLTPDDVLRLENEGLYELVGGQLVEKQMSSLATKTAGLIATRLNSFLEPARAGDVYVEQSFCCFPHDRDLVRRPDIALIVASRLSDVPEEGHVPVPPDLAIEVVSPSDRAYEVDEKVADYRAAGVKLIWVINPKMRVMRIYRADRNGSELMSDSDLVTGDPVLSAFSLPLRDLLPPAQPASTATS